MAARPPVFRKSRRFMVTSFYARSVTSRKSLAMLTHAVAAGLLLWLVAPGPVHAQGSPPAAAAQAIRTIRTLLDDQVAAWNRGDLDGFMAGYWKSPDLVFTSEAQVRRGWQATYDRYRKRYGGEPETMGNVAFEDLEITMLGADAAWVLGRWRLTRNGHRSGGVFTLVLRRFNEGWRIVHDHTSVEGAKG
ncbi:MAG: DUF4440 domain-containing protein [Luteitalea sp.]|nr:DUF4440 domain-containing protein [Luteitalea sp.]